MEERTHRRIFVEAVGGALATAIVAVAVWLYSAIHPRGEGHISHSTAVVQQPVAQNPPPPSGAAVSTSVLPARERSPQQTSPIAIIDTTVGRITGNLFPDKAPITVANFIGLANGTKEWTDPFSRETRRGVPLYDGTVFRPLVNGNNGHVVGVGAGLWFMHYDRTPNAGYLFEYETSWQHVDFPGRLSVAINGPESNASLLLISIEPIVYTGGAFTVTLGQCENLDVIKSIANASSSPANDAPRINLIRIVKTH